jgi:hypothetical protein
MMGTEDYSKVTLERMMVMLENNVGWWANTLVREN